MRMMAFFAWTILLSFALPALADEPWSQFLGPRGDGTSRATGLPVEWSEEQNVAWKTPIHGRGWSSPVVWDNQIWLTTATPDGKQMFAIAVDANSGKILHDLKLFENEEPSEIHTLNSYASPTPAIEAGRVYVHFGSYGTACLDTATGAVLWERRDLPCEHHRGPGSSPLLHEDLLIIQYDGFDVQYVVALNKQTGETVWKVDRTVEYGTDDGDIMKAYSTPIVIDAAGRKQLISPTSKAVLAYDVRTGEELWRVRYEGFSSTARPLYGNGLVYVNTGFGRTDLLAIRPDGSGDVTDTHVAWKATKSIGQKPSSLLLGQRLYVLHDGGVASCLDAVSGEEFWSKRLGGNYSSSPLAAEGRVYYFSQEGKTTVIEQADKYRKLAENKLGDGTEDGFMASPAVIDNALLLRTVNALYRIVAAK